MKSNAPWKPKQSSAGILVLTLALVLCGAPELASAAAPQTQNPSPTAPAQNQQQPSASPDQQQPTPGNNPGSAMPNPAQPPLKPVETLPEAPSATQQQQQNQQQNANAQSSSQQQAPAGAAAAQAGQTAGGAASKPAGTAIAPAKQRQVRSLLIKIGAIAGAGLALGTVYALTRATGSKPPGAK